MRKGLMSAATLVAPLAALALVACSGNAKSPTAPTTSGTSQTTPSSGQVPTSGAQISGTVSGASSAASFGVRSFSTRAAGITVTVVGTNVSATVDVSGNFTLNNVPSGDVTLQFSGGSVNASVTVTGVSDHETIHIDVTVKGSTATLDDSESEMPDNEAEVEGKIASINTSGKTFMVGKTTVTVQTSTTIAHGGTTMTFSQLVAGDRVHVQGTKTGTNAVTASSIEVQTDNPGNPGPVTPPGDTEHNNAELNGTVSALGGTCPSVHFTLSSQSVTTNSATQFDGLTCSTLANGTSVKVEGTKQTNGTVLATSVEKQGSSGGN